MTAFRQLPTTEYSHLLECGSHKATGQAQHCLCKESLCFKKNVCTVIKALPLALHHPKGIISWTLGSLWTSDSLEEEEVLPHHNQERRRGCMHWIHQKSNWNWSPTLKCRYFLFVPPSPLQRQQTERGASRYIHRHPAQSAAPQVMAAMRSASSNNGPEITTYF